MAEQTVQEHVLAPGVRLALTAMSAAAFLVSLDRAIMAPVLPAIASDLNGSIAAAGMAVTAYVIPYGLFQLFYGPLADRAGKVAVIRWAILVFALGTGLCAFSPSLLALDGLRALTGACAAAVYPLTLAFIGDEVPYEHRHPVIANLMAVSSLGNALSTAVGGIVADVLTWRALFAVYGICSLGVAAFFARSPGTRSAPPVASATRKRTELYWTVLRLPEVRTLYLIVFLEGFFLQGGFVYLGSYLHDVFQSSYLTIGLLLSLYGLATLLSSRILRPAARRLGESGLVLVGGCLLSVGFLALLPIRLWLLTAIPFVILGVGLTLYHTTLQTRATELKPEIRGTAVALFAFSLFLGSGVGTAALGFVQEWWGYATMLLVCGIALALLTVYTTLAMGERRKAA